MQNRMVNSLHLAELHYNLLQLACLSVSQSIFQEVLCLGRCQVCLTGYRALGPSEQSLIRKRSYNIADQISVNKVTLLTYSDAEMI